MINASLAADYLTDFQRLMLYWDALRPFHVVDTVDLPRPPTADALRSAAEAELEAAAMAAPVIDLPRGVFQRVVGPANVEVVVLPKSTSPDQRSDAACAAHIESELSRRFAPDDATPLRMWLAENTSGAVVGMTWRHWFADGLTAADLLRRILVRAGALPHDPQAVPLDDFANPTRQDPWAHHRGIRQAWREYFHALANFATGPFVRRPTRNADVPQQARSQAVELSPAILGLLRPVAKEMGASINDLLAAAVMQALVATGAAGRRSRRRARVRLSNIVDMRPFARDGLRGRAGQWLGDMLVEASDDSVDDVRRTAANVRDQTAYFKRRKLYLGGRHLFWIGRHLLSRTPTRFLPMVCSDMNPVSGVLSNLRLPASWSSAAAHVGARNYRRYLPFCVMPSTYFGVTTLGEQLTATVTATGESGSKIDHICDALTDALGRLCGGR